MYKSLAFGDEFLAQGLNLKSHQRCHNLAKQAEGKGDGLAKHVSRS